MIDYKRRVIAAQGRFLERNDPSAIALRKKKRAEAKKAKSGKPSSPLEKDEHKALVRVMNIHGVYFMHPPNEGKRSVWEGRRLFESMGALRGASDFYVFDYMGKFPDARGLAIELKRVKGSSPVWGRPEQQEHLEQLACRGWKAYVVRGHLAGVAVLQICGIIPGKPDEEHLPLIKEFGNG